MTADKRITRVSIQAATEGTVICHMALGIATADTWTRISALLVKACQIERTLRVGGALGTTEGRAANEGCDAGADGLLIDHTALRVGSARRWLARILYYVEFCRDGKGAC